MWIRGWADISFILVCTQRELQKSILHCLWSPEESFFVWFLAILTLPGPDQKSCVLFGPFWASFGAAIVSRTEMMASPEALGSRVSIG